MELEQGDVVLCTVDRIVGTTVFVHIEGNGEGSIVFSEVAPGRIRNIRDYVVPKKRVVCKVLRVSGDRVDLSLRRVTQKEQKELKESHKAEKNYRAILNSILGNKVEQAVKLISEKGRIYDFLKEAGETAEGLREFENIAGKENAKKVIEILKSHKKKKSILKKEIYLTAPVENGISIIKELLGKIKSVEIRYIAAGRYSLKTEAEDIKKADQELTSVLSKLEKEAKVKGAEFIISKK